MIKNIILDLGGVVLDVDYNKAVHAFEQLGIPQFHALYSQQKQAHLFDRFEKGELSAAEFRATIKNMKSDLTDQQIDTAWDSMICETPPERIAYLQELGKKYNLYLLSNTNEIHIPCFYAYYDNTFGKGVFDSLFRKTYLSSRMGMRKPDREIFEVVIAENNLERSETLFIDDSQQHIEGAIACGLQAWLLPKGEKIEIFLKNKLAEKSAHFPGAEYYFKEYLPTAPSFFPGHPSFQQQASEYLHHLLLSQWY